MTLFEMVTRYGQVSYNALMMTHSVYGVLIGEKRLNSYSEVDTWSGDYTEYDNEYFSDTHLLSGVEELVENKYIQGLLESECGVDPILYVHLWDYEDEVEVIRYVFEVHVDVGQDFQPTEECPYYYDYGDITLIREVYPARV